MCGAGAATCSTPAASSPRRWRFRASALLAPPVSSGGGRVGADYICAGDQDRRNQRLHVAHQRSRSALDQLVITPKHRAARHDGEHQGAVSQRLIASLSRAISSFVNGRMLTPLLLATRAATSVPPAHTSKDFDCPEVNASTSAFEDGYQMSMSDFTVVRARFNHTYIWPSLSPVPAKANSVVNFDPLCPRIGIDTLAMSDIE